MDENPVHYQFITVPPGPIRALGVGIGVKLTAKQRS